MAIKKSKDLLLRQYLYEYDFNSVSLNVLLGILNSISSPIFNEKDEINIVLRLIEDKPVSNLFKQNILPRLKFLNSKIYNLNNEGYNNTEFFIISTKQYSACVIFDFSLAEVNNEAIFVNFINSKKIEEILKIILPKEKFSPERRENISLNNAFLNLIKFNENSVKELNINKIENNNLEIINQNLKRDEFLAKKSRYISHEIKNHLSIIDVYTKIIEKTCDKNKNILNASNIIFNSIQNITKLLSSLKNFSDADLNVYNLNEVVSETVSASKELANSNNIELITDLPDNITVIIDKDKFQNVLLNLIKNATEALKETNKDNKYIRVAAQIKEGKISLTVENNGDKITKKNQQKIFEEGFTTKSTGSGLGLYICRKNLEEQFCELSLMKSTSAITVFEIKMNEVK